MDPITNMLVLDGLTKKSYSPKEWLQYYRNVWGRNLIARTVDVKCDQVLKATDPDAMVEETGTGNIIPVKERLEIRKMDVQDALNIVEGIDALIAIDDAKFAETLWSKEALKVDADVMPKEPKAGDACKMADGKDGVLQETDGKLVCALPPENSAAPDAGAKV